VGKPVFEAVEHVIVFYSVKSACKISKIDCPEDDLEDYKDNGYDH